MFEFNGYVKCILYQDTKLVGYIIVYNIVDGLIRFI